MNKYKIMLVDDEPDILDLLDKALTIEGYCNITKIDNGLSAINTCKEINPDIIVLDVMLPDIDGDLMGCTIRLLSWRNELKMQNYEEVLLRWKPLLWRMFTK